LLRNACALTVAAGPESPEPPQRTAFLPQDCERVSVGDSVGVDDTRRLSVPDKVGSVSVAETRSDRELLTEGGDIDEVRSDTEPVSDTDVVSEGLSDGLVVMVSAVLESEAVRSAVVDTETDVLAASEMLASAVGESDIDLEEVASSVTVADRDGVEMVICSVAFADENVSPKMVTEKAHRYAPVPETRPVKDSSRSSRFVIFGLSGARTCGEVGTCTHCTVRPVTLEARQSPSFLDWTQPATFADVCPNG
jgi:hypothetical protein